MPSVSRGLYRFVFKHGARLEDFADRLNHVWTFGLLLLLSAIVAWKHGFSKPIICNSSPMFTDVMVRFAEASCWNSRGIKYVPSYDTRAGRYKPYPQVAEYWDFKIANSDTDEEEIGVTLYQWVPIILCFQALLFKLPNIIMHSLHGYSGVNFEKLRGLTDGVSSLSLDDRTTVAKVTGRYIYNWCKSAENCLPWRWLTLLWMVVKFLNCANSITQICLLDKFLRVRSGPHAMDNVTSYGVVILSNLFENNITLWKTSINFPRAIQCELPSADSRSYSSIVCLLPVNGFSECVYMLVWVWLLFVVIVTCTSLVTWLIRTFLPVLRKRYLQKFLALADDIHQPNDIDDAELNTFANFVGEDGIFVLKLVGANSSDHVVRDIVCNMWRMRRVSIRPPVTKT